MSRWRHSLAVIAAVASVAAPSALFGQATIARLDDDDPVYRQHQAILAEFRVAEAQGTPLPPLLWVEYVPREGDTLHTLAARTLLPVGTIATSNLIAESDAPLPPRVALPTLAGILVPDPVPTEPLYRAVAARLRGTADGRSVTLPDGRRGTFVPGATLAPAERRLLYTTVFAAPLDSYRVSSRFGYRTNPVTGVWSHHAGIDLVAPFGTMVYAASGGVVSDVARDPYFGVVVTVDHRDGYQTRYAHLGEALVSVGAAVDRTVAIGRVGSTGLSTGPHVHFEVRRDGTALDPEPLIVSEDP